jgi:hypothetical protein
MPGDTKFKIGEAEFFLKLMECNRDCYINEGGELETTFDRLRYFISAFLCSTRSVLDYLKDEYTLKDNLYYNAIVYGYDYLKNIGSGDKNKKTLRDAFTSLIPAADKEIQDLSVHFGELRYFNVLRTDHVHRVSKAWYSVPHDPMKVCECTAYSGITARIEKKGVSLPIEQPVLTQIPNSIRRVMEIIFMREPHHLKDDTEVVEFCRRNLDVIRQMVKLCENGNFNAPELMRIPTQPTD